MKGKKLLYSIGSLVLIVSILIGAFVWYNSVSNTKKSYAKLIDENFKQMDSTYDTATLLSSNPYDYIHNKNYKNIVNLGFGAVEVLQEKCQNKKLSNLNSYISTIAIKEITGLDLYRITGIDYETSDEFFELWDKTIKNLPDKMADIVNSDSTVDDKAKSLQDFGIFGEALADKMINSDNKNIKFHGTKINCHLNSKDEKRLSKLIDKDENTLNEVNEYLTKYLE